MEFYRFFSPIKICPELELDELFKEKSVDGSPLVLYEFYYQKQKLCRSVCKKEKNRVVEKMFFSYIYEKSYFYVE